MLDWLKNKIKNESEISEQNSAQYSKLIKDYLKQAKQVTAYYDIKPKNLEAGKLILGLDAKQQVKLLPRLLKRYVGEFKRDRIRGVGYSYSTYDMHHTEALQSIISQLLRRKLPFKENDLVVLLKMANDNWKNFAWYTPHKVILGAIKRTYKNQSLPVSLIPHIKKVRTQTRGSLYEYAEDKELHDRADELLGDKKKLSLKGGFVWSDTILRYLKQLPVEEQQCWKVLFDHALTARASKPAKKWMTDAEIIIKDIGEDIFAEKLIEWLLLIEKEKIDEQPLYESTNSTIIRGLVWCSVLLNPDIIAREIKLFAIYCFRKIKDVGAVSTKVGNACLYVLGQLPGLDSVSMLNELMQKVKYPSARQMIEKALNVAAERNNMSREDLDELSVPDFSMTADGKLIQKFDSIDAILSIEAERKTQLLWQKPAGKIQKTIPAEIKETFPAEIKELKKTVKDIQTTLQSQTRRIEKLFLRVNPWKFTDWKIRYIEHPLLQHITHKLIWQLYSENDVKNVMWNGEKLIDQQGQQVIIEPENTEVTLWHPVNSKAEDVFAWRNFMLEHEITQPFKQAYREVYLLTDAEKTTEQYSNRFAAHVLKQHQLNALCQQRDWRYQLQGNFDSWNAPTLYLPQWNMSAEFWVEGIENSENEMGIFNYVSSDQVRFSRNEELAVLTDIEPVVFSEVMRDVDLFVGVCSIGNDPNWQDSGIHPGLDEYWREYSFGELSVSAETRKEVLEALLPKLKIAEKCQIDGRYLKVKGSFRTYKIHLGSGNILMEPNDQYLCIVEGRGNKQTDSRKLFLPFEGDNRMAVILSKAFMLADDEKIKDKTILSQIKRTG